MDRIRENESASIAIRGRRSERSMPGTLVPIAPNSPPVARPGFGSKVSIWLGPPSIQRTMQARAFPGFRGSGSRSGKSEWCRWPSLAKPPHPSASALRRLGRSAGSLILASVVEVEFVRREERPEHFRERRPGIGRFARVPEASGKFLGVGRTRKNGEIDLPDRLRGGKFSLEDPVQSSSASRLGAREKGGFHVGEFQDLLDARRVV